MFTLSAVTNAASVAAKFNELAKRAEQYALVGALNKTAQAVKVTERYTISRVFDRPTPRSLSSVFAKPATKANPKAEVWIKDTTAEVPPVRWLFPQVAGGIRPLKAFEKSLQYVGAMPPGMYAMPGAGMPLDAYGNIPSGILRQILSQLRAQRTAGFESRTGGQFNERNKRARSIARQGYRVFAITESRNGLRPGVYSADLFTREIRPLLIYVDSARYSPRFPFYEEARKEFDRTFPKQYAKLFNELLARFSREGLR